MAGSANGRAQFSAYYGADVLADHFGQTPQGGGRDTTMSNPFAANPDAPGGTPAGPTNADKSFMGSGLPAWFGIIVLLFGMGFVASYVKA